MCIIFYQVIIEFYYLICMLHYSQVLCICIYIPLLISDYFVTHITQFGDGVSKSRFLKKIWRGKYSIGEHQIWRLSAAKSDVHMSSLAFQGVLPHT